MLGRADVSKTLDGIGPAFWELRRLEQDGHEVRNGTRTLLTCHDKLRTAHALQRAGLPHPRTELLRSPDAVPGFDGPYVVKPRFGSWGRDVERCSDRDELKARLRLLSRRRWFRRQGVLVQEYVENLAIDLRLIVASGQVVGAIQRLAAPGEWRTNVALGGERRAVDPPADACALARAAAAAVEGDLVGVDLLPASGGGYEVIELNGAVDFTERYGEDVFDRVAFALAPPRVERQLQLPLAPALQPEQLALPRL